MAAEYNDNLHKGASGKLYQYGRELRQTSTNAEKILWQHLRNRKLFKNEEVEINAKLVLDKIMIACQG